LHSSLSQDKTGQLTPPPTIQNHLFYMKTSNFFYAGGKNEFHHLAYFYAIISILLEKMNLSSIHLPKRLESEQKSGAIRVDLLFFTGRKGNAKLR
jgi:hypothetical protein